MNVSTDSYLKYGVGILFLSILALSAVILAPETEHQEATIATAKDFGEFIAKNPQIVAATRGTEIQVAEPIAFKEKNEVAQGTELKVEQEQALTDTFKDWSQKGAKRDAKWRSQVEQLLELAETTRSERVLDYIKPQLIFARYDADSKNQVYAQVWIERYLKIETRDFQRKQLQDLLLK